MEEIALYKEEKKMKKVFKKRIKKIWGIGLGVLAFTYIGGVIYFSSHFLWNSTLNGINVSTHTCTSMHTWCHFPDNHSVQQPYHKPRA